MNIIVPFSPGKGQCKFLLVGADYFTKWIEVDIWKNIVCRFDIPHTIDTDNAQHFIDRGIANFYKELGIKHITSLIEHPKTNGQAEAANKVMLMS